jgi:hypothetical protein
MQFRPNLPLYTMAKGANNSNRWGLEGLCLDCLKAFLSEFRTIGTWVNLNVAKSEGGAFVEMLL